MKALLTLAMALMLLESVLILPTDAQVVPYDPETMSFPVSPEQAMASARDWIGSPDLALELIGVDIGLAPDDGMFYVFQSRETAQHFEIDCGTGEMCQWYDVSICNQYDQKRHDLWPENTQLPPAQLHSMVHDFLLAHYSGFESLNLQPLSQDTPSTIYQQRLPNGVYYCLNNAGCMIDRWSGAVGQYFGRHSLPPNIPTAPVVELQQAEQIALDYGGTIPIHDDDSETREIPVLPQSAFVLANWGVSITEDSLGVQRLSWAIEIIIHVQPGYTATSYYTELNDPDNLGMTSSWDAIVTIDAITGEVIDSSSGGYAGSGRSELTKQQAVAIKSRKPNPSALKGQPLHEEAEIVVDGMALNLKYPVRSVGGAGYLYAKYLPLLYGGTIGWRNRAVELTVAGRSAILHPGSSSIQVGGKTIKLGKPIVLIGDRVYVPCEAIPHLCGVIAAWDKQARTLRISSGDVNFKRDSRLSIAKSVYTKQR